MIVTESWLRAFMKSGIGITNNQLRALGLSVPAKKGWLKGLIGEEISEEQARAYEEASNISREEAKRYIKECSHIKTEVNTKTIDYPVTEYERIKTVTFDDMAIV